LPFPTKDKTELVLRRDAALRVKVSTNPSLERSVDDKARLSGFEFEIYIVNPDLGSVVGKSQGGDGSL
jgi:hypothetical protein